MLRTRDLRAYRHADDYRDDVRHYVEARELAARGSVDALDVVVVVLVFLGLEPVSLDERASERAADEDGGDEAEGRGRRADERAVRVAHADEVAAVAERRAVAAYHGYRGGEQRVGRFDADERADADPDEVLEYGDDAAAEPVDDEQQAALLEQLEARAEADGREEGEHEVILEDVREFHLEGPGDVAREGDEHEDEAADDGRGDAVFRKRGDFLPDVVAEQQ